MIPQAIADATANAVLNEIDNATFFEGKAEDKLGDICFKTLSPTIIGVVDPPRAGLRKFFCVILYCSHQWT